MLYLIVAVSLIVASNAKCTQTAVATDCAAEQAAAQPYSGTPYFIVVACDVGRKDTNNEDGVCTITCSSTNNYCAVGATMMGIAGGACDGTYCYAETNPPTNRPTSSPSRAGDTPPPTAGPTPPTPHPTTTPNASDRTCTVATECAAKLGDTVNAVAASISTAIPTPVEPADISEAYICVDGQCTVTCNDPKYVAYNLAIPADDLCQYVEDALIAEGETVDLECATASGTGNDKACVEVAGTGQQQQQTTTTSEPDCDNDPCSVRDACTIIPDSINGMCSVKIEYDLDVCILNNAFKRYKIMADIIDACSFIGGDADAVCSGGLWAMEKYECTQIDGAYFDFFDAPETQGECPGVEGQCQNVKKAATMKGSAGLYCPCENDEDLVAIRDEILKNAAAKANFAEKCLGLSVIDDAICSKGFGAVEANTLTVTFRNKDGQVVGDVIDITGGVKRMYYYIASVVVLVVVTFL